MSIKTVCVRIRGRVQGVWFRGWTVQQATQYDLDGWVRNRLDGSVEAVFSGKQEDVDKMIDACWRGPKYSSVESIDVADEFDDVNSGFVTKKTV